VAIVDVGSGLNHSVRRFWQAATHVLLVTTAETTSIMDAYAAIKMLLPPGGAQPVHLLANMASHDAALDVHARIGRACARFLGFEPLLAGHVDVDAEVAQATAACRPYMVEHRTSVAAQSLQRLADYFAHLLSGTVADGSAARIADARLLECSI
jgi:flagellar biosynthesis protein FlhG